VGHRIEVELASTFVGLGMDSLQAIRLRNALEHTLDCKLPPRILFQHPTFVDLRDYLLCSVLDDAWVSRAMVRRRDSDAQIGELQTDATATLSVQQRRWLSLIRHADYGQRVVPVQFHVRLVRSYFDEALRAVLSRHALLRYKYPGDCAEVMSCDAAMACLGQIHFSLLGVDKIKRRQKISEHVRGCRADLVLPTHSIPWRLRCVELDEDRFIILLGLQHIDFDGTSISVFVDELRSFYAGLLAGVRATPGEAIQYVEFVSAQQSYISQGFREDRAYFEGLFAATTKTTILPGHSGFSRTVALPSRRYTPPTPLAAWDTLVEVAGRLKVSPFAVLLSSYSRLISSLTASASIVIGMVMGGRTDSRFVRTIGPFTTHLPIPIADATCSDQELISACDRIVTSVAGRSLFQPAELIKIAPAFSGFAPDTYFSDVCINFLSYPREDPTTYPRAEVLEILGQVTHPDFNSEDFSSLRRIPGLHLVAEISDGQLLGNYWYQESRFTQEDVVGWATAQRNILAQMLNDILCGDTWIGPSRSDRK
ncbi:MAG: condensation domain-containing protein, partial [Alphaproteobacteria bacterium]|nr:condensation domain-containing protein [Alphaproteobacteria bacterium]